MLDPKYLQEVADSLIDVCQELQEWISADMIRRIVKRLGRKEALLLTSTDQWRAQVYEEAGGFLTELQGQIATFLAVTDEEIADIFKAAGITSLRNDNAMLQATSAETLSPRMQEILSDMYRRTTGEVRNFTRTTAERAQAELVNNLNTAYTRVITNAQSYTAAVSDAVRNVAEHYPTVTYPTKHYDRVEVAVLRAVRTGVAQAAGAMTIERMHEMGYDHVLVSAHLGARTHPSNPIADHVGWQGKVFRVDYAAASRANIGTPGRDASGQGIY